MKIENWKAVVGYEDYYEVSDFGAVRSVDREIVCPSRWGTTRKWVQPGVLLTPVVNPVDHYGYVCLYRAGVRQRRPVHQLVLEAFIGPCPEDMETCHCNGIRMDNRVENLRWGTKTENMADKIKTGTDPRGENNGMGKLSEDDVREIRALANTKIKKVDIARKFNISPTYLADITANRYWAHI